MIDGSNYLIYKYQNSSSNKEKKWRGW